MAAERINRDSTDYIKWVISEEVECLIDDCIYECKLYLHQQTDYYRWAKRKTNSE